MDKNRIFSITSDKDFLKTALEVFNYQYNTIEVYREFCDLLKVMPEAVTSLQEIPFLPIEFFKSLKIFPAEGEVQKVFTSSGTTGSNTSKHLIKDIEIYEESYNRAFRQFYGNVEEYVVLALLPSYLERDGSSLIYMANDLILKSKHPESGFYLDDLDILRHNLNRLDKAGTKVLLLGVSFALLDLVESSSFQLENTIVMETGGMKGRRKEMIREELHAILKKGFGVDAIHSEYGMTELLSQAYSRGHGIFQCPPWLKILIRDPEDALTYLPEGKTGGVNVIDLANINSCSFIATQDLGKVKGRNQIEILGRFDNSDIRGCNLMVV
ncbi:acyl transferase [Antarcticibacterium flavum]|uniref:Acyl transferase n=2 Tax=Antarcticibacterium flavum TaxID=2058175 RepID=A0A5B7X9Z8_9FLAO|nr:MULTISPECIES: acyl transferase [Antarcticibacterium]MCM4159426.1 acyl transferase [Antarcticibacterium sp. W02-3]QCY71421.1 acyl transferase [Antarcticibacterium flavum]